MDDHSKDPFSFDEIDQIQKEISQDLEVAGGFETSDVIDQKEDCGNGQGSRAILHEPLEQPLGQGKCCPDNSFFKETVKNESETRAKSGRPFKKGIGAAVLLAILGGLFGGIGIGIGGQIAINYLAPSGVNEIEAEYTPGEFEFDPQAATETAGGNVPVANVLNYADIIDLVEPSVVSVTCKASSYARGFFDYADDLPDSTGSGIIFDQDDRKVYVVTNNHVISDMNAISVSIEGNISVPAVVVGTNPDSDLAVISILKSDLAEVNAGKVIVATFGPSDDMRVGDFVIAIGNAMGEGNTATFGMVSATNKEISISDRVLTVIQTDAAINPGNSGGPLINLQGQVIGINTVKLSSTSVEGMGYSITSDVAMPIIEQLRNQVTKPFLGVSCTNVTAEIADIYDLPKLGVIVLEIIENSSAEEAGIKINDIITSFNGNTVYDMEQLTEEIQSCKIGDTVVVKLMRNGEPMTIDVVLKERNA